MWREGEMVYAHEQLLVEDTLITPFDPADPYRQIADRYTGSEDGNEVSEWRLTIADIEAFVARRVSDAAPNAQANPSLAAAFVRLAARRALTRDQSGIGNGSDRANGSTGRVGRRSPASSRNRHVLLANALRRARLLQLPLGRVSGRAFQRTDTAQRTHAMCSDKETDAYKQTNSENGCRRVRSAEPRVEKPDRPNSQHEQRRPRESSIQDEDDDKSSALQHCLAEE